MGPPTMVGGTHIGPISLGIRKWEWYGDSMGKGVPFLGVPQNPMMFLTQFTLRLVKQL